MEQAWSDRARRMNTESAAAEPAPNTSINPAPDDPRLPWRNGNKPEATLAVFFNDGTDRTYPYYSFEGMDVVSKGLIRVYFVRATIEIEGYELLELAALIRRQCVSIIREQTPSEEFLVSVGAPYIRKIWIHPPNMEALARKPVGR